MHISNPYIRLLLVANDNAYAEELKQALESKKESTVQIVDSSEAAESTLASTEMFDLVILDEAFLASGSDKAETLLEACADKEVPVVVLTSEITLEFREQVVAFNVLDYIVKNTSYGIEDLLRLISRLRQNTQTDIMIVDSCPTTRMVFTNMFEFYGFRVKQVATGKQALNQLERSSASYKLLITDVALSDMNGMELIKSLRGQFTVDQLGIMVMSSNDDPVLPAQYLKLGANDFIRMPFIQEELMSRVYQCLGFIERYEAMERSATTDYLTGLPNRRYFYESSQHLYAHAERGKLHLTTLMLDIDHFKKINDTYGHRVGDEILKEVAKVLKSSLRKSDLIARIGGEEFCVLASNVKPHYLERFLNRIRQQVASIQLHVNDQIVTVTISIGAAFGTACGLEETISLADEKLYEAKECGRNQVKINWLSPTVVRL